MVAALLVASAACDNNRFDNDLTPEPTEVPAHVVQGQWLVESLRNDWPNARIAEKGEYIREEGFAPPLALVTVDVRVGKKLYQCEIHMAYFDGNANTSHQPKRISGKLAVEWPDLSPAYRLYDPGPTYQQLQERLKQALENNMVSCP